MEIDLQSFLQVVTENHQYKTQQLDFKKHWDAFISHGLMPIVLKKKIVLKFNLSSLLDTKYNSCVLFVWWGLALDSTYDIILLKFYEYLLVF